MPTYTFLTITRKTEHIWCFTDSSMGENDQPRVHKGKWDFQGDGDVNNNLTITSQSGAIIYQNVPAVVISYVDELDPDNNFPASSDNTALAIITHLEANDFFGNSNGGSGEPVAFLNLIDLTPQTYFGNAGKMVIVKADGTGITFAETGAILNQNNTGVVFYAEADLETDISATWLADALNERPVPFTILETQTPVIFEISKTTAGGIEIHTFLFKKGKGQWGASEAAPLREISGNDFYKFAVVPVTVTDIENDPSTQIINYTLDPGQDVSEWLNEQNPSLEIQGRNTGYVLFKDGTDTYLWLILEEGTYGEFDQQSTMDDFQLLDSDTPLPGTPTLQQVTTAGNTTNQGITITSEERLRLSSETSGEGAGVDMWFVDELIMITDVPNQPYTFKFNNKYVFRSIGGVEADNTGDVPLESLTTALSGEFIPTSGTEEGSPVTGDVEIINAGLKTGSTTGAESRIYEEDGFFYWSNNNGDDSGNLTFNLPQGFLGSDYFIPVDPNAYTQKQYVDDAITGVSEGIAWQQVLTNNATTTITPIVRGVPQYFQNSDVSAYAAIQQSNDALVITSNKKIQLGGGSTPSIDIPTSGGQPIPFTHDSYSNTLPNVSGRLVASVNGNTPDSAGNVVISAGSGTVTSVTGDSTGGITVADGTTTPALTMSTASGTQRGTTKLYNNVTGTNTDGAPDQSSVNAALAGKQATLISNSNIKTVGGVSVLGSGDVASPAFSAITVPASALTFTGGSANSLVRADGSNAPIATTVRGQTIGAGAGSNTPITSSSTIAQAIYDLQAQITTPPYSTKTANYTLVSSDYTVALTSGSATFTLPTAVGITGKIFVLKNRGTGVMTVNTTSSQTIDGATSKTFSVQYGGMTVQSNGSNWDIIGTF